ncbi:hypothetical protein JHK84_041319 [Glycine max]|nr:hypothetical protein JHK85_041718 [Glycine max]KAG5115206.1 hypothetical protein JHK84_041319 [Glycine max]
MVARTIRYESLQSEAGKLLLRRSGKAPDDISSVVLVEKERSFIKSEAVLKIMEYIDLPFPQLAILLQFVPLFWPFLLLDRAQINHVHGKKKEFEARILRSNCNHADVSKEIEAKPYLSDSV